MNHFNQLTNQPFQPINQSPPSLNPKKNVTFPISGIIQVENIQYGNDMKEKEMIKKAKKDIRYFDMLYSKYFPKINRFVYHRVNFSEEREEIVSNVFFKALKKLNTFRFFIHKRVSFSAWLYKIAINEIKLFYRHKSRTANLINKIKVDSAVHENEEQVKPQINYEEIREKMKFLKENEQNLIALRYFEELKIREISEIFNKTEGAVKVKIHRTLKRLKSLMEEN